MPRTASGGPLNAPCGMPAASRTRRRTASAFGGLYGTRWALLGLLLAALLLGPVGPQHADAQEDVSRRWRKQQAPALAAERLGAGPAGASARDSDSRTAVAYIVLCHDVDSVRGAAELFEALYTSPSRTRFYVHIDLDAPAAAVALLKDVVARYPPDVAVMVPRIKVGWADVTMVDAELSALRAAFESWDRWSRAVVLSGTAYPIKSSCERERWLRDTDPRVNLVHYEKLWKICEWGDPGRGEHCKKTRARCEDVECTRMSKTPGNGVVYKGPQWVMVSRPFSEYVLEHPLPRAWLEFFRSFSEGPDEMYFPTVLMNGPAEFREWASVGTPRGTHRWDRLPPFAEQEASGTAEVPADAGLPPAGGHPPHASNHSHILRTPALMYTLWNSARRLGCPSYPSDSPWGWSPCWLGREDFPDLVRSDRQFARKMRAGEGVKRWLAAVWNATCTSGGELGADPGPDPFLEGFRAARTHKRDLAASEAALGAYAYTGMTALSQRMLRYALLLTAAAAQNIARLGRRLMQGRRKAKA
ncbi:core-2/I-branching enzyme-domain-containing protein [Hyaloraphidium curvatum]|nr:core-2/I-branching enzyme-domain-containing protein [Hyaloraphidium curvatum]